MSIVFTLFPFRSRLNKIYFFNKLRVHFFIACFDNLLISCVRGVNHVVSFLSFFLSFSPATLLSAATNVLELPFHFAWVANSVDGWKFKPLMGKLRATSSAFWRFCAESVSDSASVLRKYYNIRWRCWVRAWYLPEIIIGVFVFALPLSNCRWVVVRLKVWVSLIFPACQKLQSTQFRLRVSGCFYGFEFAVTSSLSSTQKINFSLNISMSSGEEDRSYGID